MKEKEKERRPQEASEVIATVLGTTEDVLTGSKNVLTATLH